MLFPLNSESMDRFFGTLTFMLLGVGTFFFSHLWKDTETGLDDSELCKCSVR